MENSSTMNFKGIINRKVNKSTNHLQVVNVHTPTGDNKNKKKILQTNINIKSLCRPTKLNSPKIQNLDQQSNYISNYIIQNIQLENPSLGRCDSKTKVMNNQKNVLLKLSLIMNTPRNHHLNSSKLTNNLHLNFSEPDDTGCSNNRFLKVKTIESPTNTKRNKRLSRFGLLTKNNETSNEELPNSFSLFVAKHNMKNVNKSHKELLQISSSGGSHNKKPHLVSESPMHVLVNSASFQPTQNSEVNTFIEKCVTQHFLTELSPDIVKLNGGYRRLFKTKLLSDSELSDDVLLEDDEESPFILQPTSSIFFIKNLCVFFCMVYTVTIYPILLAFNKNESKTDRVINILVEIILFIDIILNFVTSYYDADDKAVLNLKKCAKHYIKDRLIFDIIASLPFSTFIYDTSCKYLRLFPFCRLFKLGIFIETLHDTTHYKTRNPLHFIKPLSVHNPIYSFVEFFIAVFLVSHVSSCIQIFLAKFAHPNWLYKLDPFDKINETDIYLSAIYFTFASIISVGYGDITVVSTVERVYNILLMIIGVCLYSFAISILSSLFEKYQEQEEEENRKIYLAQEIRKNYNIPQELFERLNRYLSFQKKYKKNNPSALISTLPKHLKNSLMYKMLEQSLTKLNFVKRKSFDFRYRVTVMLKEINYIKNEYVIQEGDMIEEMYMIKKGKMQIQKEVALEEPKIIKIIKLHRNEHFGEIYMTLGVSMPYDVVVDTKYAELFYLQKSDFVNLYEEFPSDISSILEYSWHNTLKIESRAKKMYEKAEVNEKCELYEKYITSTNTTKALINQNTIQIKENNLNEKKVSSHSRKSKSNSSSVHNNEKHDENKSISDISKSQDEDGSSFLIKEHGHLAHMQTIKEENELQDINKSGFSRSLINNKSLHLSGNNSVLILGQSTHSLSPLHSNCSRIPQHAKTNYKMELLTNIKVKKRSSSSLSAHLFNNKSTKDHKPLKYPSSINVQYFSNIEHKNSTDKSNNCKEDPKKIRSRQSALNVIPYKMNPINEQSSNNSDSKNSKVLPTKKNSFFHLPLINYTRDNNTSNSFEHQGRKQSINRGKTIHEVKKQRRSPKGTDRSDNNNDKENKHQKINFFENRAYSTSPRSPFINKTKTLAIKSQTRLDSIHIETRDKPKIENNMNFNFNVNIHNNYRIENYSNKSNKKRPISNKHFSDNHVTSIIHDNSSNSKSNNALSSKRKKSSISEVFKNMETLSNALHNTKDFIKNIGSNAIENTISINSTSPVAENLNKQELEFQLMKVDDIYETILEYYTHQFFQKKN